MKAMMASLPPGTPRIPQARPINLDPPEHTKYRAAAAKDFLAEVRLGAEG